MTKNKSLSERLNSTAFFSTIIWSVCSISMILVNKLILTTFNFQFNILLLLYQNGLCVAVMYFARALSLVEFESLDWEKSKHWFPLDVSFVLMLYTGTFSLKYLSVPMVTVFKNSNNIVITFFDFLIYGNLISKGTMASLALMLVAAFLASVEDLEFSLVGYIWTLLNCLTNTAFVLYMPRAMSKSKLSPLGRVYYNNLLSLPLLVVLDLFTFNDIWIVSTQGMSRWTTNLHLLLFISGLVGFALSASAFHCMQHTSPTTYALVGSINKIPLTVLGVMLFNTVLTGAGTIYVGLSLVAAAIFAYAKAVETEKKKTVATSKHQEDEEETVPLKDRTISMSIELGNGYPAEGTRRRTSSSVRRSHSHSHHR